MHPLEPMATHTATHSPLCGVHSSRPQSSQDANVSDDRTEKQQVQGLGLATKVAHLWATGNAAGRTNVVTHRINTADAPSIKCRPARHSAAQEQAIEKYIEEMKAADVIVKSKSLLGLTHCAGTQKGWR